MSNDEYRYEGGIVQTAYVVGDTVTFRIGYSDMENVEEDSDISLGELIENGKVEATLVLEETDE